ncbi:MAG: TerC/Alx family metal homeostasis membrane protein [Nitrosopumilus sp.]|nr:TerC/Alx family metal homeostasis membrane protein [Nitrosopumilus sp.]MDH3502593.1 TerC/Alx family metal homeostasis membrane protein [Nitrosopumilus sp.]
MEDFLWISFIIIVTSGILIDLFSDHFHRFFKKPKSKDSFKLEISWTIIWISVGIGFAIPIHFVLGEAKTIEYVTGYALEKALSVDNLMVFVLIFTSLGISHILQHRVLMWGIIGAIFMRIGFILAGISLLESFHWMIYVLGAILIFTSVRMITKKEKEKLDIEKSFSVRFLKKFIPIDLSDNQSRFLVKKQGKRFATILLVALVSVEMTDLVFALDSIPAVLSITDDVFIVVTSNIFAVLGLRSLYFVIGRGIEKMVYLKYGLTILLGFIGIKMIISEFYKIDVVYSLVVILSVLGLTVMFSLMKTRKSMH